ncbi:MAG: ribonuclease E/G [Defluviitaleaceae bacterium]|nr:ribonuclease E/G [Defluviitaleaceae bacterium]
MKRLLIDHQNEITRTACMTDRQLTEIFIDYENSTKGSQVGHIINGVVQNILPSRFAFIDIGQDKNAFMNLPEHCDIKPGQYIPVQVRKDASGDKGAAVSDVLQFKGRFAILYPSQTREIGVSQKIGSPVERKQLKKLAGKLLPDGYSVILRTQAEGLENPETALQTEFLSLINLCNTILEAAKYETAPKILYRENQLLTDLLTDDIDEIISAHTDTLSQIKNIAPAFAKKLRLWDEEALLFDAFNVTQQITKALYRKIWLPCGGFVTFDPVEACVVIDVNTGKFAGKKNYKETVLKANLEAAETIATQIALRNLSGMIIVDFIDMADEANKIKLLDAFDRALKRDRIPADIVGMTELGLVQLTRRKQREPLSMLLQQTCPHCNGTGKILI